MRALALLLLVGFLPTVAGAEVVHVPLDLPADGLLVHGDAASLPFDAGQALPDLVEARIHLTGLRAASSWWSCFGDEPYVFTPGRGALEAGFLVSEGEGPSAVQLFPFDASQAAALPQGPTLPLDLTLTFDAEQLGALLEGGAGTVLVGPWSAGSLDPCWESGPGAGGIFSWFEVRLVEAEVVLVTSGGVGVETRGWGTWKARYR